MSKGRNEFNDTNISIFQDIMAFDSQVKEYIKSVQKFNPQSNVISKLLVTDSRIEDCIKLLINHQNFGSNLKRLQQVDFDLNNQLLNVLTELNDCRTILLDLPDDYDLDEDNDEDYGSDQVAQLEQEPGAEKPKDGDILMKNVADSNALESEQIKRRIFGNDPLTTGELLKYAARLAKFTTIPATSDLNIGPNNYIWPAEDALRKGMLATAMRYGEQLILYKKKDQPTSPVRSRGEDMPPVITQPEEFNQHRKTGSFEAFHRPTVLNEDKELSSAAVTLDLFDSDEESD